MDDQYSEERDDSIIPGNLSEALLEAARPDLYRRNAFRVTELSVDATTRDLAKRQKIIDLAKNTGLTIPPGSGRALPLVNLTDTNTLRDALHRIRDPELRLTDEFFWFWPYELNKSSDDKALQALAHDDSEKAREIWNIQTQYQSEANISIHNLAVLNHIIALDLEIQMAGGTIPQAQQQQRDECWKQTYKYWQTLLAYDNFWRRLTNRIRELDDPRLTTGMARRIQATLPIALLSINAQLSIRAADRGNFDEAQYQLRLMNNSGFTKDAIEYAVKRTIAPIRDLIKSLCRSAESMANSNPDQADNISRTLLEQARRYLVILDILLPVGHPTRNSLHDQVAQQLVSCLILYCNQTKNWEVTLRILNQTLPIAVSPQLRAQLEENIQIIKSNIPYDQCWYCNQRKPDTAATHIIKMHGDVKRTPFYQFGRSGARVTWSYTTISVPRCSVCKKAHSQLNNYAAAGFVIGCIICLIWLSVSHYSSNDICGGIFLLLVFMSLSGLIGYGIGRSRLPKGIRQESDIRDFPVVKQRLAEGWQMGEKPAT